MCIRSVALKIVEHVLVGFHPRHICAAVSSATAAAGRQDALIQAWQRSSQAGSTCFLPSGCSSFSDEIAKALPNLRFGCGMVPAWPRAPAALRAGAEFSGERTACSGV